MSYNVHTLETINVVTKPLDNTSSTNQYATVTHLEKVTQTPITTITRFLLSFQADRKLHITHYEPLQSKWHDFLEYGFELCFGV